MWYHDIFSEINMTFTKKPKSIEKFTEYNNNKVFQWWLRKLINIALTRYDFENLPDTVDERVLKLSLLYHGSVCFFLEQGHLMALPGASGTNGVTVYGDYTYSIVYGRNGWTKPIPLYLRGERELKFLSEAYLPDAENKKPIGYWFRENWTKTPFIDTCIHYAEQLADAWVKMENIRAFMAVPFAITGYEAEKETADRVFERIIDNVPYVFLTRNMTTADIGITTFSDNGSKLKEMTDHIEWNISRYYMECGKKTNSNPDKMSGMSDVEVLSGDEAVMGDISALCRYIQQGLDEVNYHFGTNIKVVPGKENINVWMPEEEPERIGMVRDAASGEMGKP